MYDKKKILTITIPSIIIIIFIIALSIFFIIYRERHSSVLEIVIAPTWATLTLNGQIYTNGTYDMEPGVYNVKLEAEGFEPLSETIELPAHETTHLYRYLTGPDGDISYYSEHGSEEEMNWMTIMNYEAGLESSAYAAKDPVLSITPYYDEEKNHFRIYANVSPDDSITITVNLNTCTDLLKEQYITEANKYLKDNNINLNNYTINYVGLCD